MRASSLASPTSRACRRRRPSRATVVSTPSVDAPVRVDRARLALGVRAHELGRLGAGRVVLDVGRRDDLERDPRAARGSPAAAARSRRGRAVSAASCALTPDSSDRPLASPTRRCGVVVLVRRRALRRVELDEALDLEARSAEQVDQLAVAEVELTPSSAASEPVHTALRTQQRARSAGPLVGRRRASRAAVRRKTSRPPGRSSRAASGSQRSGSHQMLAPYSEKARSKLASGSGTSSALASTSGNSIRSRP